MSIIETKLDDTSMKEIVRRNPSGVCPFCGMEAYSMEKERDKDSWAYHHFNLRFECETLSTERGDKQSTYCELKTECNRLRERLAKYERSE